MQWGGLLMIVSFGQLLVATALMAVLLVAAHAAGLGLLPAAVPAACGPSRSGCPRPTALVRERVGDLLGAVSESVVGASTVRAYAIEERTGRRIDDAIEAHRSAATRAQALVAVTFSTGEVVAGLANAAVVVVGVLLGIDGDLTLGAAAGLPVPGDPVRRAGADRHRGAQRGAERDRRLAAGARRPRHPARRRRPRGRPGRPCRAARSTCASSTSSFAYPGGPTVLDDVDLVLAPRSRVAVVGETGSGKTTFAKLLTRLMDPADGSGPRRRGRPARAVRSPRCGPGS